jgi:hypothetical protein
MTFLVFVGLGAIAWAIYDGCVVIARAIKTLKD